MWSKVRQLTGRSKTSTTASQNSGITADRLNDHYAAISSDSSYTPPCIKATAINWDQANHITECRLFDILDTLRPTSIGRAYRRQRLHLPFTSISTSSAQFS